MLHCILSLIEYSGEFDSSLAGKTKSVIEDYADCIMLIFQFKFPSQKKNLLDTIWDEKKQAACH